MAPLSSDDGMLGLGWRNNLGRIRCELVGGGHVIGGGFAKCAVLRTAGICAEEQDTNGDKRKPCSDLRVRPQGDGMHFPQTVANPRIVAQHLLAIFS